MRTFGDKRTFAFRLGPLAGPPPEGDPSAALTWAELEIWLDGQNLTRHVHTGSGHIHNGLHWPVIYLSRWLTRSWPHLFEMQVWPLAGWYRNARDVCNALDQRLIEIEDALEEDKEEEDPDEFAAYRDDFVSTHALAAGAAGGLVPDLYIGRDGDRVSVAFGASRTHANIWFLHERGERDVPVPLFVDAVQGLIAWTAEQLRDAKHPICAEDRSTFSSWLDALAAPSGARAVLFGYLGIDEDRFIDAFKAATGKPRMASMTEAEIQDALELENDWTRRGALLDASRAGAAMVFRALSPSLEPTDILNVLATLRAYPPHASADAKLQELRRKLPSLVGYETDYDRGYHLAEAVRAQLGNSTERLDVEQLLVDWGLGIEEMSFQDPDVDGGAVWDDHHGPVLIVNRRSPRAATPWGRRMVLAHELCHLVLDRSAAHPLKIISGNWAPPLLERRANAFAAELLLPRAGITKHLGHLHTLPDDEDLKNLMDTYGVGQTMCIEHIQNRFRLTEPRVTAQIYRAQSAMSPARLQRPATRGAQDLKELLRSMPDVGEDADFERPRDYGRDDEPWGT